MRGASCILGVSNLCLRTSETMASKAKKSLKSPPERVRGLKEFDPEQFHKTLSVPALEVPKEHVGAARKLLKDYLLKMANLMPVQPSDTEERKKIYLDPDLIRDPTRDIRHKDVEVLERLADRPLTEAVNFEDVDLTFHNWRPNELLDAVLEDEAAGVTGLNSYANVGHVIHVNLRDNQLPQKRAIGEILLLHKNCRTVVNKTTGIDNTFRNFSMELLAGEEDYLVTVKENGTSFKLDFSKVYWNPRLGTEHKRIVDGLEKSDEFFDVFAGVGPFSVPAAKMLRRKDSVFANDLNPESSRWLRENVDSNKVGHFVNCYNMDGRDFIRTVLGPKLAEDGGRVQVAMNLPAIATEFLDAFRGAVSLGGDSKNVRPPLVHAYAFAKEDDSPEEEVEKRCKESLGCEKLPGIKVSYVRNVSPNKGMYRASFQVPTSVLISSVEEPERKRTKCEDN